ncbi:hypothetical protein K439DRAFT_1632395 [Ramaria rubella]|nr:hypothetical protein K439DRAFT_1632395 [Ramaria rubella]
MTALPQYSAARPLAAHPGLDALGKMMGDLPNLYSCYTRYLSQTKMHVKSLHSTPIPFT